MPATDQPATRRKLILVVIDGLRPDTFESAVDSGNAPALRLLAENGSYSVGASTFPSLTPVCLSSIATGAHPDVHRIPHLVWYHRGERRLIEYGSSFSAVRAAGLGRSLRDTILNMNRLHLGRGAVTVYEALEDAGYTTAAINMTCYRGRTRHLPTLPGVNGAAYGPKRFFYFNLFESDVTGAPLGVLGRSTGSLDGYAAAVGRWLVTRDGFDFLVYYLPDYDFASHATGHEGASAALARADAAVGALIAAGGGPDDFLERYAVVLCSDHGHSRIEHVVRLQETFSDLRLLARPSRTDGRDLVVTASNRAAMLYRLPGCQLGTRALAERLDEVVSVDAALFLEDGEAVVRREREELRFAPDANGWRTTGDVSLLRDPNGLERVWAALANPNAGEVIVSAAHGYEFADLAGRHHRGGSHGSLLREDSEVPLLTVGVRGEPRSITDLAPLVLGHFGVSPPAYTRPLARAA
ncbi:MAG: alkaline phosphatase family protein [Actinomycetota bacterium]|nr:alkaline phosphatase family protein [Actinomycetota bacterium]